MTRRSLLLTSLCAFAVYAGNDSKADSPVIPFPDALASAEISESTVRDLNKEALPIGNGDLNALVFERDGGVVMRVAKNDIWDARMDTSGDVPMLKVDLEKQKWTGGGNAASWKKPFPSPHVAGLIRIGGKTATEWVCIRGGGTARGFSGDGTSDGRMTLAGSANDSAGFSAAVPSSAGRFGELRFSISGVPGSRYYVTLQTSAGNVESGWKESPAKPEEVVFKSAAGATITGVILYIQTAEGKAAENQFASMRLTGAEGIYPMVIGKTASEPMPGKLDLRRAVATVGGTTVRVLAGRNAFLIEGDADVSLDEIRAYLPAAESGETDGVEWLRMKMPGDVDWPGMEYSMAVAEKGSKKVVAVVTSRDTKGSDTLAEASRLARSILAEETAKLVAAHEAEWLAYWAASGVKLGDAEMQGWWYRMVYMMRCQSKPGVIAPGLWTFQPTDVPAWHGDYHHNYNSWQPNWAAYAVNHPDQAEPWIRYMKEMLPRLKWLAKETYDCEGACVGISSFAYEPADPATSKSRNGRHCAMTPWGNTMGMIGMSAQILWYEHLYRPDRARLERDIWPVIREAALFFASFAEKCPRDATGKAKFGPSYSPEHGGFGIHDCPFDLGYARLMLKAGITAATELGGEAALVARYRKALDSLPDYPTAPDAKGNQVVVDWTGCRSGQIGEHNITVPTIPVFPADQITWFSPEAEKELFRNTMSQTRHRGCNSTILLSVAKARLGMPEAYDDLKKYYQPLGQPNGMFYLPLHGYYVTENTGVAAGITEFLLQSVNDVIRVFPGWPADKDAAFEGLRAQGGFLVAAERKGGEVTMLTVSATTGGKLRLIDPRNGNMIERNMKAGERLAVIPDETTSH